MPRCCCLSLGPQGGIHAPLCPRPLSGAPVSPAAASNSHPGPGEGWEAQSAQPFPGAWSLAAKGWDGQQAEGVAAAVSLDTCRCRRWKRATQTCCSCPGTWSSPPRQRGRCLLPHATHLIQGPSSDAHQEGGWTRLGLLSAVQPCVRQEPLPNGVLALPLRRDLVSSVACPRVTRRKKQA